MRIFLSMVVDTKKKNGRIQILTQFFPLFIRNPLIDCSSHLDLVAQSLLGQKFVKFFLFYFRQILLANNNLRNEIGKPLHPLHRESKKKRAPYP